MKLTYIERFIKDECSNYDKHQQTCLSDKPCKALNGQRCGYFEKAVLGPPDYKYRLPGYDYAKLFGEYAQLTGAEKQDVKVRRCDCGTPLTRPKQKVCSACKTKNRKATYRRSRGKRRAG
jgi:hypothetical protein